MRAKSSRNDQSSVTTRARRLLEAGEGYDVVLTFLKTEGVTKLDSIKFLCGISGLSLLDAKRLVHNSIVWKDSFNQDEKFHSSLLRAVADLGSDEPANTHSANSSLKAQVSIPKK